MALKQIEDIYNNLSEQERAQFRAKFRTNDSQAYTGVNIDMVKDALRKCTFAELREIAGQITPELVSSPTSYRKQYPMGDYEEFISAQPLQVANVLSCWAEGAAATETLRSFSEAGPNKGRSIMTLAYEDIDRRRHELAEKFPRGAQVAVTRDDGSIFHTTVRESPWPICSGAWLILVDGITGGYDLDRVTLAGDKPEGGGTSTNWPDKEIPAPPPGLGKDISWALHLKDCLHKLCAKNPEIIPYVGDIFAPVDIEDADPDFEDICNRMSEDLDPGESIEIEGVISIGKIAITTPEKESQQ